MSQALHEYHLHTDGEGRVAGTAWTNDNLDHGQPSEDATWDVRYKDREHALRSTGGTHVGVIGCQVRVYIDGVELDRDGKTVPQPAVRRARP